MHIISLFLNYCLLTHIENVSDYCICRTNYASVRPCKKISRTPLSTIKDPILQLQSNPLPPEAVEVLKLGPKFALTPKEVPKMEIMAQVENAAL